MNREIHVRIWESVTVRCLCATRHNAPTESFFNSLKNERVHGTRYATREEAKADIFEYIEVFYNRKRLHSTLGYVAPQTYLQNWISSQNGSELAA
jgi:putative transposase